MAYAATQVAFVVAGDDPARPARDVGRLHAHLGFVDECEASAVAPMALGATACLEEVLSLLQRGAIADVRDGDHADVDLAFELALAHPQGAADERGDHDQQREDRDSCAADDFLHARTLSSTTWLIRISTWRRRRGCSGGRRSSVPAEPCSM